MLNNIIEKIKENLKTLVQWTKEAHIVLSISWVFLAVGYFFSSVILFILAVGLAGYGGYLITKPDLE
jgi:hypothetical protein